MYVGRQEARLKKLKKNKGDNKDCLRYIRGRNKDDRVGAKEKIEKSLYLLFRVFAYTNQIYHTTKVSLSDVWMKLILGLKRKKSRYLKY